MHFLYFNVKSLSLNLMSCVLFVIKTILHGETADGECSIEGYNLETQGGGGGGGRIAVYISGYA